MRALATGLAVLFSLALAALVVLTLPVRRQEPATELFGVDAFGPGDDGGSAAYGPVDFQMGPRMKAALKEYASHGGAFKRGGSWGSSVVGDAELERRRQLGPQAADMLGSSATAAALKAYREALGKGGAAATQQLSQEEAPATHPHMSAHAGPVDYEWSNGWHPNRQQDSRGSGLSLLQSRGTQAALRELEAHQQAAMGGGGQQRGGRGGREGQQALAGQRPLAPHLSLAQRQAGDGSALLATKLSGEAGFEAVHDRGQALEAFKDLLKERLGDVGQQGETRAESLSTSQGLRVQRARLEGLVQSIEETERDMRAVKAAQAVQATGRGRIPAGGYKTREQKLRSLQRAILRKESAVHQEEGEAQRLGETFGEEQRAALAAQRREMAAYGKADMARNTALTFSHKLLAEKAHSKLLANKVQHALRRASAYERDGERLRELGEHEESSFEHMAGPVHKAQEEVKVANQAYNAAELRLARAETTAEELAGHPKLRHAAMERIERYRKLSIRMEALVRQATERLQDLDSNDGPLTGLDSHFESPKKRAVRKLARARQIRASLAHLKEREKVLKEDVKGELPSLKRDIARAKVLHKQYESARKDAEAKERRAEATEEHAAAAKAKADKDCKAVSNVKEELREATSGMGHQLLQKEEGDWKSLQEMHEELITDKENYEAARRRSCEHGGPCPPKASSGLPYGFKG